MPYLGPEPFLYLRRRATRGGTSPDPLPGNTPPNALTLNGKPLTLNGKYLVLGA